MDRDTVIQGLREAVKEHLTTYTPELEHVLTFGNGFIVISKPQAEHDPSTAVAFQVTFSVARI